MYTVPTEFVYKYRYGNNTTVFTRRIKVQIFTCETKFSQMSESKPETKGVKSHISLPCYFVAKNCVNLPGE